MKRAATARSHAPRLAREARVDEILTAARDLFSGQGYEVSTMAGIAARVGVVEGLVYKYFATKRDLLLQVLAHWYEEMFGDYTRELAGLTRHRDRLHRLIWRHLRSVRDDPQLCRLMFREVQSGRDYRGTELHALNRRYTGMLLDVIEAGVAAGEFRADIPPPLLRSLVYGGIEHHSWAYIVDTTPASRRRFDIDTLADQITVLLCDGLVVAAPAARPHRATRLSA